MHKTFVILEYIPIDFQCIANIHKNNSQLWKWLVKGCKSFISILENFYIQWYHFSKRIELFNQTVSMMIANYLLVTKRSMYFRTRFNDKCDQLSWSLTFYLKNSPSNHYMSNAMLHIVHAVSSVLNEFTVRLLFNKSISISIIIPKWYLDLNFYDLSPECIA